MENIDEFYGKIVQLMKPEHLLNILIIFLKSIFLIIVLMIFIAIILGLLNEIRSYNPQKIWEKRIPRTSNEEIGGGQEYFFRYWVWQRNKRKNILLAIRNHSPYEDYYPRQKWVKKDKSKLPFRREIWVIK
ncbi:hypothetical protein RW115_12565 [Macrococcus capreoli]